MRARQLMNLVVLALGLGAAGAGTVTHAQEYEEYPLEARVWLDRGHEPVLQRGEAVRVYYRVSESAFVAIFHIDTNGTTRLVFPTSPQENHFARGGRDYRVLFPGSSYWYVGDDPGMGYFFIVASPEPFSFADLRYSHYDGGWDLSFVGRQVYGDPYLAMDDYVAALIPDWEYIPYGLDAVRLPTFHVLRLPRVPAVLLLEPLSLCLHQLQGSDLQRPVLLPSDPVSRDSRGVRPTAQGSRPLRVQGTGYWRAVDPSGGGAKHPSWAATWCRRPGQPPGPAQGRGRVHFPQSIGYEPAGHGGARGGAGCREAVGNRRIRATGRTALEWSDEGKRRRDRNSRLESWKDGNHKT
jgi:hypothetical protein